MKSMRIFVITPMQGKSKESIFSNLENIRKYVIAVMRLINPDVDGSKVSVINTYDKVVPDELEGENRHSVWRLGNNTSLMAECNVVIFDSGYKKDRECEVEEYVCEKYEIPHMSITDDSSPLKQGCFLNNIYRLVTKED